MRLPRVLPLLVLALATLPLAGVAAPASAVPPTERTIEDPVEPGKAFDVVSVRISAARTESRKARVVIRHDRPVDVGDAIDLWVDTDDDRVPDLFVTGPSYSEYAVYRTHSWTTHGRNITDEGCASLKMIAARSVVKVDPSCLAPSTRFAVSVRSHVQDRPARTDDYVPRPQHWTKKVLSILPS